MKAVLNKALILLLVTVSYPLHAGEPVISIIIDDMGDRLTLGRRAINLPGVMTYAFLPQTPHAKSLAEQAHEQHKQVMLHQPMAAQSHRKMGPGGIRDAMTAEQLDKVLSNNLASVPYAEGINNHMGSLLTQHQQMMDMFMHSLARHGHLFFVDSRTTSASVALEKARKMGIASTTRDIFLDHHKSIDFINQQIDALIERSKHKGYALAIGHPYRETLEVLEARLPLLQEQGIRMIKVSDYITRKHQERLTWHESSSPLHKVVKN
jgi:polysaccharide deacetylase 2 family uncharacterized protein YibQ